jgi:multidrug efflux pump subunit AcrA (membrane-fusion protein)
MVSSVGTVASVPSGSNGNGSSGGGSSGSGSTATIPVTVTLKDPSAAGTLDQAPVTVNITTATVPSALVVPVGALLAQSSGGYAVEVVGAGSTRRLVPVTIGIFDDTDGLVQVTGALTPGEQVVVPSL